GRGEPDPGRAQLDREPGRRPGPVGPRSADSLRLRGVRYASGTVFRVIPPPGELVREVLLRRVRVVVRVDVADTVAELARARIRGVAKVRRRSQVATLADVPECGVDGQVGGVRL